MDTRNLIRGALIAGTSAAVTAVLVTALPVAGQGQPSRGGARMAGKPNLNGIWQALNEANYDLEQHMARPASVEAGPRSCSSQKVIAFAASAGSGVGVVDGPILSAGGAREETREPAELADARPGSEVLPAGVPRATPCRNPSDPSK